MSLRVQMPGSCSGRCREPGAGVLLLREAAEGEWYKGSRDGMSRLFVLSEMIPKSVLFENWLYV